MHRLPRIAIALRSILFFVAVVVVLALSEHLASFLEIVVLAGILAAAMVPAVNYFQVKRKQKRIVAVGTVFGLMLAAVVVTGAVAIPLLLHNIHHLATHSAEYSGKLHGLMNWVNGLTDRFPMLPSVDTLTDKVSENASEWLKHSLGVAGKLVGTTIMTVVTFVTAFFMLLEGPQLRAGALSLARPEQREMLAGSLDPIVLKLGGYVQGMLISIVVFTVFLAVILMIFQVPLAMLLALLGGFCAIIPMIGGYVGLVPITIAALTVSWKVAIAVFALGFAGNWLVGHVLMPIVFSKSVHLSPLMVMLSLLLGAETMGIFGALTAVPILAAVQVLINNLYVEPMERLDALTDRRVKCMEPVQYHLKWEDS